MSVFQRLFGNSKKQDPNNISSAEAIQRLSGVEELLNKKLEHLESEIEIEKANALRQSKQGNRRGALNALKRKKKHENTLRQIDGTITTLEIQRESLNNASSNMEVFRVMKLAAGALKKSNQNLEVEDVHDLMDNLSEQNTIADEIANAISSPGLGTSDLYNDADLKRELEELAGDEIKEDMMTIGPLPDVPRTNKTKERNDPSRELEDWAV